METPEFKDRENFRNEMIQVAAVAVAMIEDLDHGSTSIGLGTRDVQLEVLRERAQQELKWGSQHHRPHDWLMILMEEVGEAAEEIRGPDVNGLRQVVVNNGRAAKRYLKQVFS